MALECVGKRVNRHRAGFPVDVVADSAHNLKVTTADDFRLAEALARELR